MALEYGTDAWEAAYREILEKRLRIASKPYMTGTPEWVDAYEKEVQKDEEYKEIAAQWEGTVTLHTIADPNNGMKRDLYILMDLWHGDCRGMRIVPPEAGEAADYVISGTATTWKRLSSNGLDTNKAIMQGKIKLKGDLATLVRYRNAAERLGALSAKLKGRSIENLEREEAKELLKLEGEFTEKLL
jgi:putative sterol carrier protein